MTSSPFPDHTLDSAPAGSRPVLAAMAKQGHVPVAVARLAASPQLLNGFLKASGLFESTGLDPVAREVVVLTIATRNRCHICVAMHTERLEALGASPDLISALVDCFHHFSGADVINLVKLRILQRLRAAGAMNDVGYFVQGCVQTVAVTDGSDANFDPGQVFGNEAFIAATAEE